jgi:hypothetical protein
MTMKGLYARLACVHSNKIHKYFTPPAIKAGIRMTWDPITKKKVSSEEDCEVNDLLGLDDDMTFKIPASSETEAELGKRKIVFRSEKTGNSVLTFTKGSKRPLHKSNRSFFPYVISFLRTCNQSSTGYTPVVVF